MLKVVAIMTNAIAIANGNSGMVGVGEELLWVGVKEDPGDGFGVAVGVEEPTAS